MGCTVTEAANRETLCRSYWWGWNCYYGLSNSNREQKNWLFNSYRLLFDCTSAGIVLLCIYGKWLPLGWESSNSFCHNFFFPPCSSVFSLVIGSLSVSRPFWLSGARNGQSDKLHPFNPTVSQTLGGLKPLGDVSMLGFVWNWRSLPQ